MRTRKSLLIAVVCLVAICAAVLLSACADNGAAIVTNGDFENGTIDGWTLNDTSSGNVTVQPSGGDDATAHNGTAYSVSVNASSAWTYMTQEVSLKNNSYYRLSVRIRIQNLTSAVIDEGEDTEREIGVVLGFTEDSDFEGLNITSANISDYGSTSGRKWVECYIYFQAKATSDFTLFVGIGNSSASPSGLVYFDDISIVETDSSVATDVHYAGMLKEDGTYSMAGAGSYVYVVLLAVFTVVVAYLLVKFVRYAMGRDAMDRLRETNPDGGNDGGVSGAAKAGRALTSPLALFTYAMLGAFLVRFIVAITTFGFGQVSSQYYDLYSTVNTDGWGQAYSVIPGIPSLSAYVIWIFARIAAMLGVQGGSMAMAITLRIPTILADIITCYLIYSFAARYTSVKQAACYAGLYALLPVFFTQSALYGSYLSLAMPFVMGMMHVMLLDSKETAGYAAGKSAFAGVLYTFALLFSNWVILLLPMILIYQVGAVVKTDKAGRGKVAGITAAQAVGCLVVFYLLALPMMMPYYSQGSYFAVFDQMYAGFKTNSTFMSTDAFNMYAMFGLANSGTVSTALEVCTWLFGALLGILAALNYFLNGKSNADLILISGVSVILFAAIGTGVTVEIMTLGLLLLLAYIIIVPDIRLITVFSGLALTHFLNVAQLVGRGGFIASSGDMEYLMFPSKSAFVIVFSVFTVLMAFVLVYITLDICYYNRERTLKPYNGKFFGMVKSDFRLEWLKAAVQKRKEKDN